MSRPLLLLCFAASLFALPLAAQTVIVSDGDFSTWVFGSYTENAPGGVATATREAAGGNPGARINVTTVTAGLQTAFATAFKADFATIAAIEGAVFTMKLDVLNGPGAFGDGQAIQILVDQAGTLYARSLGVTGLHPTFEEVVFLGAFVASTFTRVSGPGPATPVFDGSFPTQFGFAAGNTGSLALTKFYDNYELTLFQTDLAVTKTASVEPATAGAGLTYTIEIDNLLAVNAAGIVVTDSLPAGTNFVSAEGEASTCSYDDNIRTVTCTMANLAGGDNEVITLEVTLDTEVQSGTTLTNTAMVTTSTSQTSSSNDFGSESTAVVTEADLNISKSADTIEFAPGDQIEYTIEIENEGPSDASLVQLTDVLLPGTRFVSLTPAEDFTCNPLTAGGTGTLDCTAATLSAGDTATFTLVVEVGDPFAGTSIANTATVSSATTDPASANNTSTATTRASVSSIPTVSEWALIALMAAFAAIGALRLRS